MTTVTDLRGLQTESRNPKSTDIDNVSTLELCRIINNEDETLPGIVKDCIPTIANAIDALVPRVRQGGRVVYVGAGTSGRLGVLDASEIPPTYSAPPSQFVGLIAGRDVALRSAKEGAEDSWEGAVNDLSPLNLDGEKDALISIASSGRTPYVLSCLAYAKSKGCVTIGIACSAPSAMSQSGHVDFMMEAVTGPEVITGSTRMKAGTATKLILNMLSTGVMIKIGKTYGNIMIDVKPTNIKLEIRARRILREICGDHCPESDEDLDRELRACGRNVKLTAVKLCLGVSVEEAERRLREADGVLANILKTPQASNGRVNGNSTSHGPGYVLCVDGGGSKCSAVIASSDGAVGHGESGPCNPSDIGILGAVSAIKLAIQAAVDSCDATKSRSIQEIRLLEAYIGLAGGDREAIGSRIRTEVTAFLSQGPDITMSVTNDIEMLATASSHQFHSDDVIVLVAGTGSIAMRYRREGNVMRRVARAGGWGALLGDDGSGFDIGREAVRAALRQIDNQAYMNSTKGDNGDMVDALVEMVFQHFRPVGAEAGEASEANLLNNILLSASGAEQTASQTKQKIASCAKAVVDASATSRLADDILQNATECLAGLVRTVSKAVDGGGSKPLLILAGGLMSSDTVRDRLASSLEWKRLELSSIEHVANPASIGARYLAQKAWHRSAGV